MRATQLARPDLEDPLQRGNWERIESVREEVQLVEELEHERRQLGKN